LTQKSNRLYALIMAGGRGTRFWPRSRKAHPKQVLPILSEASLIQETVERLCRLIPADQIFVITSESLRPELLRQLPGIPRQQIVAEPAARNTAPCIGLGAHLIRQRDSQALMGVFPADHAVTRTPRFVATLRRAFKAAASGDLVVVGIPPRWPETGYGYLEFPKDAATGNGAIPVKRFREKPDAATAKRFVKAGNYFWNSGMFFWRAEVFLDALNHHMPFTALQLESMRPLRSKGFERDLAEFYPLCENVSVDYGVMEKADNVTGVVADDFGWSDVGSWQAVYELSRKDKLSNAARTGGLLPLDARGNYVDAHKPVALIGVDDLVVVDTPDALLVTRRSEAHRVGELVKLLEARKREELL